MRRERARCVRTGVEAGAISERSVNNPENNNCWTNASA